MHHCSFYCQIVLVTLTMMEQTLLFIMQQVLIKMKDQRVVSPGVTRNYLFVLQRCRCKIFNECPTIAFQVCLDFQCGEVCPECLFKNPTADGRTMIDYFTRQYNFPILKYINCTLVLKPLYNFWMCVFRQASTIIVDGVPATLECILQKLTYQVARSNRHLNHPWYFQWQNNTIAFLVEPRRETRCKLKKNHTISLPTSHPPTASFSETKQPYPV